MKTNETRQEFIAHIDITEDGGIREHALADHLRKVAEKSSCFASSFASEKWAWYAGIWHDLGKYRPGFQRYIRQANATEAQDSHIEGKVPGKEKTHSAAGAMWAMEKLPKPYGHILAYLIASHHAGLYDWNSGLEPRLLEEDSARELKEAIAANPPEEILKYENFNPNGQNIPGGKDGFALWVRMLFSCLVDADFLDTEIFFDEEKSSNREGFPTIENMLHIFNVFMAEKSANAPNTSVNKMRADVLQQCRNKAELMSGFFSLTVPTGGGKTLSSLAFALKHANLHKKNRIIYAIPYTSIIEQTANIFREVFKSLGDEVLVEHHSQADADPKQETARSRLACENWDASLIVTTNVQLFESLFSAKTSRCRKLHNLVNSVIILDEAQQLPPEFLQPIFDVLNLLVKYYGVCVVICTATQPALTTTNYFDTSRNFNGPENVREIIDNREELYEKLCRVNVELPSSLTASTPWESIAVSLTQEDCVLAIVNTRNAAKELYQLMPEGTLHLSALMCGAHRSNIIDHIKKRLKAKREGFDHEPLRVISTQLVEAGVDLDFPVVWRALAGLDSIAQAAGRCNREGLMTKGKVVVFVPPNAAPPGLIKKGVNAVVQMLSSKEDDPLALHLITRYFQHLYYSVDLDEKEIGKLLTVGSKLDVQFRSASKAFKLIEDEDTATVIVRYQKGNEDIDMLINMLKKEGPQRRLMRKLQRYTVNIKKAEAEKLLAKADLTLPIPGLYIQENQGSYHKTLGFLIEDRLNPYAYAV